MTHVPATVATSICLDCAGRGETWANTTDIQRRRNDCATCDGCGYVAFETARTRWPMPHHPPRGATSADNS